MRGRKNLSTIIQDKVSGDEIVDFYRHVASGELSGSTVRDQMEAYDWLSMRGWGKVPDVVVNVDADQRRLAGVSDEVLLAYITGAPLPAGEIVEGTVVSGSDHP